MTTFWMRVEKKLKELDMTEADLSKLVDIAQSSINGWKTKDAIPRADIAYKTAKALKTSIDYLLSGIPSCENTSDTNIIPILNQELSAGFGEPLPENDVIQGLLKLPSWLRKEFNNNLAALYVHGDSMEPTLHNGDLVVCDSLGWDKGEGLYAIRLNGLGYVKRIQVGIGVVHIKSDNPHYQSFEEPIESDCLNVIGKVRLIVHPV